MSAIEHGVPSTRIEDFSDDEVIADMQRRLSLGTCGYHGLYSDNQRDAIAYLRELRSWLDEQVRIWPEHSQIGWAYRELVKRWSEIEPASVPPFLVFGINTTFLGKSEIHQDHSPKAA